MVGRSAINEVSKEDLQNVINESRSYRVVLHTLGYVTTSGAYRTLHKRITRDNLDVTILEENYKQWHKKMWPEEKIYAKNSLYTRGPLKRRILRDNLIPYVCSECGNDGEWNGKKLVLQLEHINGIGNDNRLKNLTFLCPNCHSQTDTYAGKKPTKPKKTCQGCGGVLSRGASYCKACIHVKSIENHITCQGCERIVKKGTTFCRACIHANSLARPKNTCQGCEKIISRRSTFCTACFGSNNRKTTRPSREQLYNDLVELSYVGTGEKYGITGQIFKSLKISTMIYMKRGYLWKLSSEDFARSVADATNWSDLTRKCGYAHPTTRQILKKRVLEEGLDTSHFQTLPPQQKKRELTSILVKNSPHTSTKSLKERLLRQNILAYECSICHITDWQDQPLTLEMDHINGDNRDNRLSNLRLLCPNCHAQTPTFRGKNVQREKQLYKCPCGTLITNKSVYCNRCAGENKRKFNSSYEELYDLVQVQKLPFAHIGKLLGVTDNSIRKRCKILGISLYR